MLMEKSYFRRLLINYNRRLQKLRELQALSGQSTDAGILIEIEDIEQKIEELQATLKNLSASSSLFIPYLMPIGSDDISPKSKSVTIVSLPTIILGSLVLIIVVNYFFNDLLLSNGTVSAAGFFPLDTPEPIFTPVSVADGIKQSSTTHIPVEMVEVLKQWPCGIYSIYICSYTFEYKKFTYECESLLIDQRSCPQKFIFSEVKQTSMMDVPERLLDELPQGVCSLHICEYLKPYYRGNKECHSTLVYRP